MLNTSRNLPNVLKCPYNAVLDLESLMVHGKARRLESYSEERSWHIEPLTIRTFLRNNSLSRNIIRAKYYTRQGRVFEVRKLRLNLGTSTVCDWIAQLVDRWSTNPKVVVQIPLHSGLRLLTPAWRNTYLWLEDIMFIWAKQHLINKTYLPSS